MTAFTPGEIAYLQSQRLGRIATAANGQPHVVPVTFRYNPAEDAIDIGGHGGFAKRKKYRDVQQNPRVAFVVDDIVSFQPWKVRGVEIRGEVEILPTGGSEILPHMDPEMFRLRPRRIVSWGIDGDMMQHHARSVG